MARVRGAMPRDKVFDWLLEADQPSIRYLALTQLLRRNESDADVEDAKASIPKVGGASEILARRDPAGWWARDRGWLEPRFLGTHWNMLALAALGGPRAIPEAHQSTAYWM